MSNRDPRERRFASVDGVSRTQQHLRDDADINKMSDKLLKQRMLGNAAGRKPFFGVVPSETYHEMMNKVALIDEQFAKLPARMRTRFRNRPEFLLRFLADETNRKEAIKMGLIEVPPDLRDDGQQVDLEEEARKAGEPAKADEEAQPRFKNAPAKAGEGGAAPKST